MDPLLDGTIPMSCCEKSIGEDICLCGQLWKGNLSVPPSFSSLLHLNHSLQRTGPIPEAM
jgi:hypothetical protein